MARKTKSPLILPQTDNMWYCAVRKLRTFIQVNKQGEEYFRPSVIMVVDMNTGMILMVDIVKGPISGLELNNRLAGVMLKPPKGSGIAAHRPNEIHFEDEALVDALQPLLSELQVTARYQPQRENMDAIIQDLEKSTFGNEAKEIPGLLQQPEVKPEQVGSLFSAASTFYQAEPWVQLSNSDILAVQIKERKSQYFVIIMGQGGEEYGLSVFRSWQEVETFFNVANPFDSFPRGGRHVFSFNEPPYVSFDDLDAIEKYGWELPAPDLVPTPSIYLANSIKRPDAAMLHWYEVVLRAIPVFVSDYLETERDGRHPPVKAKIEVETYSGMTQVNIRYPGGDISTLENQLSRRFDFSDVVDQQDELESSLVDRRGMEGIIAQLAGDLGNLSVISDPALKKAQQIMYDAWEERRPAQRIALAKKALKISPNCADAYVLLAEEDAQTPRQALLHYQAGVKAGRQALGDDFFADSDNIGHYWGIIETRPFMRAMEGLATTQWKLGLREEALRIYRELLHLNPGDNQGIRYLLLNLLMELGQDEQARALLQDYEGDWSAEAAYTAALLAFREKGDSPESKQMLVHAFEVNQHVPDFLTGKKRIPYQQSDTITMGGADEAAYYASEYLNYWRKTPGAVDWLQANHKK